jgi:salicylate hydroxylase
MSRRSADLPILIIGGGIGGVAAALALARKGRRTLILEQASELGEVGAGIQMPPNAFKAFRALGVLDAVQAVAAYPERLVLGDMLSGEPIYQSPIDDCFISRFGFAYALMHRGDLLAILVEACQQSPLVSISTNARVVGCEDDGDGVRVTLADGTIHDGEAVIAADGLWSRTRCAHFDDTPPQTDGYVVCRGVVPLEQIPAALRSNSVTMWAGPELDLFHYPLRRGEIFNLGASFRDTGLIAGAPHPIVTRELLEEKFRSAAPRVRDLLGYIDISRTWVLYDRPPIETWCKERIALLGDAAHPMTIYISQGACQALEDAVVIAEMIARHPDIATAFAVYGKSRYLRAARVQLTSRQFGEIYHARGVNRNLRNRLLTDARPVALHDTLAWVFGEAGCDCMATALTVA